MLKRLLNFDIWTKMVVLFLWFGGLAGKFSAYLGLLLGALLLFSSRLLWDRWYKALTRNADVGILLYLTVGRTIGPMFRQQDVAAQLDSGGTFGDLDPHPPDPTYPEMAHARGN